jgi:TruD family tRNA pseudouridine synthase
MMEKTISCDFDYYASVPQPGRKPASNMVPLKPRGQKIPPNMSVGNFRYVKKALELGELSGNEFTIAIRGVHTVSHDGKRQPFSPDQTVSTIRNLVSHLSRHGFVNYFGLQRFGTGASSTHAVGAALLRCKCTPSFLVDVSAVAHFSRLI